MKPSATGNTETLGVDLEDSGSQVRSRDERLARADGYLDLRRGDLLSRYIVIDMLGRGGMGVVVSAYDPDLDRKVAIKVLRPPTGAAAPDHERLVREARAMAKLTHENVVSVYDVGTVAGQTFVVMQFVSGGTLSDWLRSGQRSWAEVVEKMIDAGRGLAAAHRASLIHRDFKPANIVIDALGRARVTDFGLVRTTGPAGPTHEQVPTESALMGTPSYMAPEQLLGGVVDARADQYSFCVTLYQCLWGRRPFDGKSWEDRVGDAGQTPHLPTDDDTVPPWLRALVIRGLAPNVDDRFSSMDALLGELVRDRADEEVRQLATSALYDIARVHQQHGDPAIAERNLSAALWSARDSGNEELEALTLCSLTQLVGHARGRTEEGLAYARDALALVDRLGDIALRALYHHCRGMVLKVAGRYTEAKSALDTALALTEQSNGDEADIAAIIHEQGQVFLMEGCFDEAAAHEARALVRLEAVAGEEHPALASIVAGLGRALLGIGQTEQAVERLSSAVDIFARQKGRKHRNVADALIGLAAALRRAGRAEEADEAHARAQRIAEATLAPGDPLRVALLNEEGNELASQGRYKEAVDVLGRALLITRAAPSRHVNEELILTNRGAALLELGRFDEALADYERVLSVLRRSEGSVQALLHAHNNVGAAALSLGRLSQARDAFETALALTEEHCGDAHPAMCAPLSNLAATLSRMNRDEDARPLLERAISVGVGAYGEANEEVARHRSNLGQILRELGEFEAALALHQIARETLAELHGGGHPRVAFEVALEAQCLGEMGRFDDALPLLEKALRVWKAKDYNPYGYAEAQFQLARAMCATDGDKERARKLAASAREVLASTPGAEERVEMIDAWSTRQRETP